MNDGSMPTVYALQQERANQLTGCSIGSNNPVAETYTYDGRGNIATGFNHLQSLAYKDANRLQQVIIDGNRTVYYQYDGTGQ